MEYITYRKYNDQILLVEMLDLLKQNGIDYIVDDTANFDITYTTSETRKEFRLKLQKDDFKKADELLLNAYSKHLNEVDSNHYLLEFSNEELIDVLAKPDEWSQFDYLLAQKILKEKGQEISAAQIESLQNSRIKELSKPAESQTGLIIFAYILALLGGFLSIIIGWHLATHVKILPNGNKVAGFSNSDRVHGNRLFWLGISMMVIYGLVWLWRIL